MTDINYPKLGERIRRKRRECGYTQEKLAEICDISTGFLGHIEKGTRKLSLDTLFRIANALDASIDMLLLDSSSDNDNFFKMTDFAARKAGPEAYSRFKKTVGLIAEHIDEL